MCPVTAPSVGYQIQNLVNLVDGTVDIDIKGMIRTCRQQNDTFNPLIDITDSFIFNFWEAGCYVKADYPEYAQLFNDVLSTMRRCLHPCNRDLRYTLPDINCTGQAYPNTISINYHCGTSWQLPEIVASTSTVPAMTTARSAQTTTATPDSVVSSAVPGLFKDFTPWHKLVISQNSRYHNPGHGYYGDITYPCCYLILEY